MLVYGDHAEVTSVGAMLGRVSEALGRAEHLPSGVERHAALVEALIAAGGLAQGVADAAFEQRGCDARSPAQVAAMELTMALASAVQASWAAAFTTGAPPFEAPATLPGMPATETISVRQAEGYAFYALYPEAFAQAAAALRAAGPVRVIGIRSIGTGLAAMVAVALGAPCPVTVRPVGHPFRREIRLAPELDAELVGDRSACFAIVDEGPGLSGSSFGAVADHLEGAGIGADQIVFFPSHAHDLGPQAQRRHRERWARARSLVVHFDDLVLQAPEPAHRLESWIADAVGPLEGPLEEVSGGGWRQPAPDERWPPANLQQERRKFLARSRGQTWLAKFAGLGGEARRKLAMARALHEAGFTPEPAGVRHGFLVERWHEDARPLDPSGPEREALLAMLPSYLGFRARAFPAGLGEGASVTELHEMACANAGEALGEAATAGLERWRPRLRALEGRRQPIRGDNRLHAWEWLVVPDGRLLKSDALDHHAAHDLVGCQDLAWDIAGATIELGLSPGEAGALAREAGLKAGRPLDPDLVDFCERAYAAFQLGAWTMAAAAHDGHPEAMRLRAAATRYADRLRALLGTTDPPPSL